MNRMEELKQLKTEYNAVKLPENGSSRVLEAVARAKKDKKRRQTQITGFGTIAASLLLIFLLGIRTINLEQNADSAAPESNMMMDGFFGLTSGGSIQNNMGTGAEPEESTTADAPNSSEQIKYTAAESAADAGITENGKEYSDNKNEVTVESDAIEESKKGTLFQSVMITVYLPAKEDRMAVAQEVLSQAGSAAEQIKEMLIDGALSEQQSFYINEENHLVITFDNMEFIIPDELVPGLDAR